jgi:hypothetical protein
MSFLAAKRREKCWLRQDDASFDLGGLNSGTASWGNIQKLEIIKQFPRGKWVSIWQIQHQISIATVKGLCSINTGKAQFQQNHLPFSGRLQKVNLGLIRTSSNALEEWKNTPITRAQRRSKIGKTADKASKKAPARKRQQARGNDEYLPSFLFCCEYTQGTHVPLLANRDEWQQTGVT